MQLEQEKKQLETAVNGLRVPLTQLELYTRNVELEELRENTAKETAKLKKESNSLIFAKKKLENDLEDAKNASSRLEKDLSSAQSIQVALITELKRLQSELDSVKEASEMCVSKAKAAVRTAGLQEVGSGGHRPALSLLQTGEVAVTVGESSALLAVDRLISQLSQGSLTYSSGSIRLQLGGIGGTCMEQRSEVVGLFLTGSDTFFSGFSLVVTRTELQFRGLLHKGGH